MGEKCKWCGDQTRWVVTRECDRCLGIRLAVEIDPGRAKRIADELSGTADKGER